MRGLSHPGGLQVGGTQLRFLMWEFFSGTVGNGTDIRRGPLFGPG